MPLGEKTEEACIIVTASPMFRSDVPGCQLLALEMKTRLVHVTELSRQRLALMRCELRLFAIYDHVDNFSSHIPFVMSSNGDYDAQDKACCLQGNKQRSFT